MIHCVLGYGEVGKAIYKVLKGDSNNEVYWKTKSKGNYSGQNVNVLHVCIPFVYDKSFKDTVKNYKYLLGDPLIIVHSSVALGTCDALGVVHSPVRGVHPHLAEGIKTFYKYFGGTNQEDVKKAANIFKRLGIKVRIFPDAQTTEALKLWDTTQYGRLIMLEKEIYEWCNKNKIDFDSIYRIANKDYNEGYTKLGKKNVVRPYLKHIEGPIGGHCVLPNAKLLGIKL